MTEASGEGRETARCSKPPILAARSSGSVNCASGMIGVLPGVLRYPRNRPIGAQSIPCTAKPHSHVLHPLAGHLLTRRLVGGTIMGRVAVNLPGSADLVPSKHCSVVFVYGCFSLPAQLSTGREVPRPRPVCCTLVRQGRGSSSAMLVVIYSHRCTFRATLTALQRRPMSGESPALSPAPRGDLPHPVPLERRDRQPLRARGNSTPVMFRKCGGSRPHRHPKTGTDMARIARFHGTPTFPTTVPPPAVPSESHSRSLIRFRPMQQVEPFTGANL